MRSFAVVAVLASAVYAQSSSSPLIPSGISQNCTQFLTSFNEDTSLQSCTAPLIKATAQFGPNGTATPSASAISSALTSVCSSVASCSSTAIQSKLASFYAACTPELTTDSNADVLSMYDVLYSIYPYTQALCAKDESGNFCAAEIQTAASNASASASAPAPAASAASTSLTSIAKSLWSSVSGSGSSAQSTLSIVPNATTFADNNVLFLLLQPSLSKASLCTACSRNVLTAYINFESSVPYAAGLTNSPLLKGQSALYSGVQNTCGASFLNGAVAAAGGLSGGILSGGAAHMMSVSTGAVSAVVGGAFIALLASL